MCLTVVVHGPSLSDHRPSHAYNAMSEHVGLSPAWRALLVRVGGVSWCGGYLVYVGLGSQS